MPGPQVLLLKIDEAAQRAGVDPDVIRQAVQDGQIERMLPQLRGIRVCTTDVDKWTRKRQRSERAVERAAERAAEDLFWSESEKRRIAAVVERQTVYRLFNRKGELLYVGVTGNLRNRLKSHAKTQRWWRSVSHITEQHFPNREAAEMGEGRAIDVEHPRFNKAHPYWRHVPDPAPAPEAGWAQVVLADDASKREAEREARRQYVGSPESEADEEVRRRRSAKRHQRNELHNAKRRHWTAMDEAKEA